MGDAADFQERRRPLVEGFLDLADSQSSLGLQSDLAAELRMAEASPNRRDPDLASHKRLLRAIGDSLAFSFLHEHTIRTLTRHPGLSPGVTDQGDDFAFTMDVARSLAEAGYLPVICDLTNLLMVGDIVAACADHVLILECKKSALPTRLARTGRLARQRARGTDAAEYLQTSRIPEVGGRREAIRSQLPSPQWNVLAEVAQGLSPGSPGFGVRMLGEGDAMGLATSDADLSAFLSQLADMTDGTPAMIGTRDPLTVAGQHCLERAG